MKICFASSADTPFAEKVGRASLQLLEIVPGVPIWNKLIKDDWNDVDVNQIGRQPPLSRYVILQSNYNYYHMCVSGICHIKYYYCMHTIFVNEKHDYDTDMMVIVNSTTFKVALHCISLHLLKMHDPGGKLESSVRDIEGRKAIYVLLRNMIETGTIPKNFPSLSSVVARYNSKSESPSSLWNSSDTVDTIPFAGLAVADTRSVSLKSDVNDDDVKKDYHHHDNNKIPLVSATLIQQRMNTAGGKVCDYTNKQYV